MATSEQTINEIGALAEKAKGNGELEAAGLLYTLASVLGQPTTGELAQWLEFGNASLQRQRDKLKAMVMARKAEKN